MYLKTNRYKIIVTEQGDLPNTITNVLGLSVKQRKVTSDEEYDMISAIINCKYDKIREWYTIK